MSRTKITAKEIILGGYPVDEVVDTLASNSTRKVPTVRSVMEKINSIVIQSGGNPGEVNSVLSFGAQRNAVVPSSGNTVTGFDNKQAFDQAIAATPNNGVVYVPPGQYYSSPLNPISGSKILHWLQDGDIFTNNQNFMTISGPGTRDRCHTVLVHGRWVGRVNMLSHSKSNYDAGLIGDTYYNAFGGAGLLINQNVNSSHFCFNQIEGFASGIKMVQGGGNGSQENTFAIQKLWCNNRGIHLVSTDGLSWCDKNYFVGWDGGHLRITGNICLVVDGFSGPNAVNGEIYNGAFRSNYFEFLAEAVTDVMDCQADMTEPEFRICFEGGTNTGIFGTNPIRCRSISPNFVRAPKWTGLGVITPRWMQGGMGIEGSIHKEIWDGGNYYGSRARITSNGMIVIEANPGVSATSRSLLPSNFRIVTTNLRGKLRLTSAATAISPGTDDHLVDCLATTGTVTVTLPATNTNMGREIVVRKLVTATIVNVSNGDPDTGNQIPAGVRGSLVYLCDNNGSTPRWRLIARYTL